MDNWRKDIGIDEVRGGYQMSVMDGSGKVVAYAIGDTIEECENNADIIVYKQIINKKGND